MNFVCRVTILLWLPSIALLASTARSESLPTEFELRLKATDLSRAVWKGDLDEVRNLLAMGRDPNAIGGLDGTYVGLSYTEYSQIASHLGVGKVKPIVRTMYTENRPQGGTFQFDGVYDGSNGYTVSVSGYHTMGKSLTFPPLIIAISKGHNAIASELVSAGADINYTSTTGRTALMYSAEYGNEIFLKKLVALGADVNATDDNKTTALMLAAKKGHEAVARALMRAGAQVSAIDNLGQPALAYAVRSGRVEVAAALVGGGADVNRKWLSGKTALTIAAELGHAEMVGFLLEAGAEATTPDSSGRTALMYAAGAGSVKTCDLLLDAGTQINHQDTTGETALMTAVLNSQAEIAGNLMSHPGADIEISNNERNTALLLALETCQNSIASDLIRFGADVNKRTADGKSALMLASRCGNTEMVNDLVDAGLQVNSQDKHGMTALMYAARKGNTKIVEDLIAAGSNVDSKSEDKMTALMYAIEDGCHNKCAMLLITHAARLSTHDVQGRTALDIAKGKGCTDLTRRLRWARGCHFDFCKLGFKPGSYPEIAVGMGLTLGRLGRFSLLNEAYYVMISPKEDSGQGPTGMTDIVSSLKYDLVPRYNRVHFYCRGGVKFRRHLSGSIGNSFASIIAIDTGIGWYATQLDGKTVISLELRYTEYITDWLASNSISILMGLGI